MIKEVFTSEQRLGAAYLRLRTLIPGAFNTPYGPSSEEVWETTERGLMLMSDVISRLSTVLEHRRRLCTSSVDSNLMESVWQSLSELEKNSHIYIERPVN